MIGYSFTRKNGNTKESKGKNVKNELDLMELVRMMD